MQTEIVLKCPSCGKSDLRPVSANRVIEADDGAGLAYVDELIECTHCGERFYSAEQALASTRARIGALRTYESLLTPEQIIAIRKRHGLSQADLEKLLDLGEKTVVRWERGTVCQSRAADKLLRLLASMGPGMMDELLDPGLDYVGIDVGDVAEGYDVELVPYEMEEFPTSTMVGRFSGEWDISSFTNGPSVEGKATATSVQRTNECEVKGSEVRKPALAA